jgi:catechol 2,3-dioxygenase-like lactoylglutathione lyase family enzyme
MNSVFDHIGYNVADFPRSLAFYEAALAPLGLGVMSSGEGWAVLGGPGGRLWIGAFGPAPSHVHVAFSAADHEAVEAFHAAALKAGGRDNGAPGPRPNYGPDYYAAFVIDPDGHNIEAICRATS